MLHLKKNKDDIGMQARNKHEKVNQVTLLFFLKTKKQCSNDESTHTQLYTSKWNTQPTQKNDSDNDNAQVMKAKEKIGKRSKKMTLGQKPRKKLCMFLYAGE